MNRIFNRIRSVTGINEGISKSFGRITFYLMQKLLHYNFSGKKEHPLKNSKKANELFNDTHHGTSASQTAAYIKNNGISISICVIVAGSDRDGVLTCLQGLEKQYYPHYRVYLTDAQLASSLNTEALPSSAQAVELIRESDLALILKPGFKPGPMCLSHAAIEFFRNRKLSIIYADDLTQQPGNNKNIIFRRPAWSPHLAQYCDYTGSVFLNTSLITNHGPLKMLDEVAKSNTCSIEAMHIPLPLFSAGPSPVNTCSGTTPQFDVHPSDNPVSIIIPNRNSFNLIKTCIESIQLKSTYKNYEIILLDNRSSDRQVLDYYDSKKSDPSLKFRLINCDFDFNFSKLINTGAAESNGEFLILLNNDTEVITPSWIELMMAEAVKSCTGAVGVKLLYPDSTVQHCGVTLNPDTISRHEFVGSRSTKQVAFNALNIPNNFLAVTAACLMIDKRKFYEAGGFNEALAVEYNDIDFCLKLVTGGYYNVCLPQVSLYHYESASRRHPYSDPESLKRHKREKSIFTKQWGHFIENDPYSVYF